VTLTVRPVSGSIGAFVDGVDLGNLDDAAMVELRRAWLDHLVLFFRDQDLTPDQFSRFARRFGEPARYPFLPGIDGHPEIIEVLKQPHELVNFGGIWHSDSAYLDRPPMASMLLAREVPAVGGDTEFASGYAAYAALSEGLRAMLDQLEAVHSSARADVSKTREDRLADLGDTGGGPKLDFASVHPVVRTHPETDRRALYVNIAHTERFSGWTEEESRPLLEYLFAHQVREEFTCRFRWEVGSLAVWDNRCALHNPINDYQGQLRRMHRITLEGDVPI
jgi:taurine dioxygenase